MFAKLAVTILALGACGCAVLAARQSRLQAAHELAQTQLRIRLLDERLFRLRTEIGYLVRPEHVQGMVAGLGPLKPITPTPPGMPGDSSAEFASDAPSTDGTGAGDVRPGSKNGTRNAIPGGGRPDGKAGRPGGATRGSGRDVPSRDKSRADEAQNAADAIEDGLTAPVDGDAEENRYAAQDTPEDER